jgi:hypothetical protein
MRKFFMLLALALLMAAAPLSQSFAQGPPPGTPPGDHFHPWPVICGVASVATLMIGSQIKMNDPDDMQRRQLTITEATWLASVCPVFLPLALISTITCADNKATLEVARLAYLYVRRRPGADQSPFTNAYAEACREGRLSRATRVALRKLSS